MLPALSGVESGGKPAARDVSGPAIALCANPRTMPSYQKGAFMKRLTIVLLAAVTLALASPIFGQRAFVEGNVPDGKALVYIYYLGWSTQTIGPLVIAKDGPVGVLLHESYCRCVTDPGTIKLWLAAGWVTQFKFEAIAGQIYYVKADLLSNNTGPDLKLIPNEKAKPEIARCKQLTE